MFNLFFPVVEKILDMRLRVILPEIRWVNFLDLFYLSRWHQNRFVTNG